MNTYTQLLKEAYNDPFMSVEELQELKAKAAMETANYPETNASSLIDAIMGLVAEDIENGDVVTEILKVEEVATEIMSFIGQSKAFLTHVTKAKPEKAYSEALKLANMLAKRTDNKFGKEETERVLNHFKEINEIEDTKLLDKAKAVFSIFLVHTGKVLLGVVGFTLDTACISGIYLTRLVLHFGKETQWAAKEVGASFKKRILNK